MVIQRNWRPNNINNLNTNLQQQLNEQSSIQIVTTSSSDDSNSSCQTNISCGNTKKPTSSSNSTAENVLAALKQRYSGRSSIHSQSAAEGALKSLELLRANIQGIFDREIDSIVKKFLDMFFIPAIKNIKENLGENCINDDQLKKLCSTLLEYSKIQYNQTMVNNTNTKIEIKQEIKQEIKKEPVEIKNEPIEIDNNESYSLIQYNPLKRKESEMEQHQSTQTQQIAIQTPVKKSFILPLTIESFQSPILTKQLLQDTPSPQHRVKPVIWNTSIVNLETQFILDIKASRVLGLNETKDRLSTKHPELIRYLMDNQDKDWMVQQKIISPISKNFKYLILVKDEVLKLAEMNSDYQRNYLMNQKEFQTFRVSEFILKKIQKFFCDLNLKSRFNYFETANFIPLMTVSAPSAAASSSSSSLSSSSSSSFSTSTMSLTQNFHAISQTQSLSLSSSSSSNTTQNITLPSMATVVSSIGSSATSLISASTSTSSASSSILINNNKSRSTLSSTHATLSALLSNHNETNEIEN